MIAGVAIEAMSLAVGVVTGAMAAVVFVFRNFETKESATRSADSIVRRLERIEEKLDRICQRFSEK